MSHSTAIPNNALETPGELYLDGGYAERNPDWHQGDSPWKAEQILKMMGEMGMQPKSICEIGCGAGEILAILQKSKPECTFAGYEIAPQAFQIAATKSNGNLKFHQELRPEAGEHFDVMLIIDVVEHVDDCFDFLRKLRPQASAFILHIPLDLSVFSVLREWPLLKRRKDVGHIHYFTKSTALATLEDAGFHVQRCFYTNIDKFRAEPKSLATRLFRQFPHWLLSCFLSEDVVVRIFGEYSVMVFATPNNDSKNGLHAG